MNSNYISELPSCSSFNENDLFVISQQDKYISNQFNTCAIDGTSMIEVMFRHLLNAYDFGSAAYVESCSFSPYNHNHNDKYNNISLDFAHHSSDNVLSIGNMFINGMLMPLNMPVPQNEHSISAINEPYIGALKFVALSTIGSNDNIPYKSTDFDGWLYPDGSSFMLSDFSLSDALNELYGNGSYTSFTLPNINNFIKLNNGLDAAYAANQISSIAKSIVLKNHAHSVNLNSNISASIELMLPSCRNIANSGVIMPGCGVVQVRFQSNLYVNYQGQQMKMTDLIYKLQNDRYQSTKPIPITNVEYIWAYLHIDDFETICKAIDDTYPNAKAYENAFQNLYFKLPQINNVVINDVHFSMNNNINVMYASSGENDETYPTHVILPVMIYVGKRR